MNQDRDVSFVEVDSVCRVALREPIHLCTCMNEEGGDVLRARKQQLARYGVGEYECSFTASGFEIVLVDNQTVFPCVHMKVTDNDSNIKKTFKFFDDSEGTYRKRK